MKNSVRYSLAPRAIPERKSASVIMLAMLFLLLLVCTPAIAWDCNWHDLSLKGSVPDGGTASISGASSFTGSDLFAGSGSFAGTQNVFFDFDSATNPATEHTYTLAQRDSIVAAIEAIYAPWDFTFSHTAVPTGSHAVITFNDGPAGGLASDVDFRNLDLGGSATVDVNGILGFPAYLPYVVGLSKTIGAHELGHLVGLRHADSLGPIGYGLAPRGPSASGYFPVYPGPALAVESTGHTMASPGSIRQTISEAVAGTVMGERSAVKLEFNEMGTVTPETAGFHSTPATAQPLSLPTFSVPNTALPGDLNFGKALFADAEVITAAIIDDGIPLSGESDYYSFSGFAGDVINAEVLSFVPNRLAPGNPVDPEIGLYMPDGATLVSLGAGFAFNDDEFESEDSALIDVILPTDGTYYVRVSASTASRPDDLGDYELFLYRFGAVTIPEPTTACLLVLGVFFAVGKGRRLRLAA
jgi:hypothetical protein